MAGTPRNPSSSGNENGTTKSSDTRNPSPKCSRNRSDASHSDDVPVAAQRKSESEGSRQAQSPERNPAPIAVTQKQSWSMMKINLSLSTKKTTPSARSILTTSSRESSLCTHSTSGQSWPTEVSPSETSRQSWPTERIGLSAISRPSWRSAKVSRSGTTMKTWSSTKVDGTDASKGSLALGRFSSSAITRSWQVQRSRSGVTRRSWLSGRFSCSIMTKPRPSTKRCTSSASRQSWPSLKPCHQADRRHSKPSADFSAPVEVTHVEHLLRVPKNSTSEITRPPSWSSVKAPEKPTTTKQLWPASRMAGHPWTSGSFSPQSFMGRFWTGEPTAMTKPYWVAAKISPLAQRKCSRSPSKISPDAVTNYWPFTPVAMTGQSWPYAKFSQASVTKHSFPSSNVSNYQPQSLVPRQYWPTVMTQYNPPPVTKNLWQLQKICPHAVMGQTWNPSRLMPTMSRQRWNSSGNNPPAFAGVLWAPARFNPSGMNGCPYSSGKAMSQSLMRPWSSGRNNPQVPWLASKVSRPTVTRYFGPAFMNCTKHVPWQSSVHNHQVARNMWPFPKVFPQMMTNHPMFPTRNHVPAINNR